MADYTNQYTNPMSNIGYINQDFQTIYPQFLTLANELTDKWDPSQSNESDPAVVLIKEMAILADKVHYSIDKQGLETFPESVTQLANARELFDQFGYTMQWYIGSTGEIYLRWLDRDGIEGNTITIPMFTMISNEDQDIIYTTTRQVILDKDGTISEPVGVIQGTVHDYEINGEKTITAQNLDEENRLYFRDYNVAENGIFINNIGEENWTKWKAVDNLHTEKYGDPIFKFGVLQDNSTCYIEFPEYVGDLFGKGIQIKYILTDGADGNVKANALVQFYGGANGTYPDGNQQPKDVALSQENVQIIQSSAMLTGYDPESISSAYRNYKKTVGTFNTLVSLQDYNNYLTLEGVQAGLLSNGFTTDRTNDIQDSYYIVTVNNDVQMKNLKVEKQDVVVKDKNNTNVTISEDSIKPFELKLYLLKYSGNFETVVSRSNLIDLYDNSFSFLNSIVNGSEENPYNVEDNAVYMNIAGSKQQVLENGSLLDDVKLVSNYFTRPEAQKILYLKNKYPLNITIVPNQVLSQEQKNSMTFNIQKALSQGLNGKMVSFGEEINYDEVFDIIKNSDGRIRTLFLDDLTYITSAVYFDATKEEVKEVEISDEIDYIPLKLDGSNNKVIDTVSNPSYVGYTLSLGDLGIITETVSGKDQQNIYEWQMTSGGQAQWNLYSDKRTPFREEIFAKSVLAGKTQFLLPDSQFKTSLSQKMDSTTGVVNDIEKIDTHFDLFMNLGASPTTYTLGKNEGVYLTAPNLITEQTIYGVRYVCQLSETIPAGTNHRLGKRTLQDNSQAEEYIIAIYKQDDSNNYYNFIVYREGAIISADITLNASMGTAEAIGINVSAYSSGTGGTLSEDIAKSVRNYFTTSQALYIKKINETNLVGVQTGDYKPVFGSLNCYWILNNRDEDEDYCTLFKWNTKTAQTYTLKTGEYFMYTTSRFDEMVILGSGTKIEMTPQTTSGEWTVKYVSEEKVLFDGVNAIDKDDWKSVTEADVEKLTVTEMQIISLAEGDQISMTGTGSIKIDNTIKEISEAYVSAATSDKDGSVKINIDSGEEVGVTANVLADYNEDTGQYQEEFGVGKIDSISEVKMDNTVLGSTEWGVNDSTKILTLNLSQAHQPEDDFTLTITGTITGDGTSESYSTGRFTVTQISSNSNYVQSLTYQFFGDTTVNNLDISGNVIDWSISSILLADLSPSVPQTLVANGVVSNNVTDTVTTTEATKTVNLTKDFLLISSVTVGGTPHTDYTYESHTLKFEEEIAANIQVVVVGGTELSIVSENENTVGNIDYIRYYKKGSESYDGTFIPTLSTEKTELNLLSSFEVSSDRQEGIDTRTLVDSEVKYLSIYPYTTVVVGGDNPSNVSYNSGNDTYTYSGSGNTGGSFTLETSLPSGQYLIPYSAPDGLTVTATYGGTTLGSIKPNYKNFNCNGLSGGTLSFTINSKDTTGNWSVVIGSAYCYKKFTDTNFNATDWDNVLTKISALDDEHIFDFTYQVDPDVLIENPLKSKSFLDPNHIYNQYTICQLDFSKLKEKILNRNRG